MTTKGRSQIAATLLSALLSGGLAADVFRGGPTPQVQPDSVELPTQPGKTQEGGSEVRSSDRATQPDEMLRAIREYGHTGRLSSGEDCYGAAAVLLSTGRREDLLLAKDLAMIAMERGFGPGYRLALDAHRRFLAAIGLAPAEGLRPVQVVRTFQLSPPTRNTIAEAPT